MKSAKNGLSQEGKKRLGLCIRALRETVPESQAELAKVLDVDRAAVCQWENGRTAPSTENIRKLAEHFGVPTDRFLRDLTPFEEQAAKSLLAMGKVFDAAYLAIEEQLGGGRNEAGDYKE